MSKQGGEDFIFFLYHQAPTPGGLASTATTPESFLFDLGGHVVHSHYAYFDDLVNAALGSDEGAWNTLTRAAFVRCRGRWVPYPFQHNLGALPPADAAACLAGAVAAAAAAGTRPPPATFDEWIVKTMGTPIADLFMRPYNAKVWGHPPDELGVGWLGDRVAGVDVEQAAASVARAAAGGSDGATPSSSWGPNAVFRFPARGGTGAIWAGVARLLPRGKVRCGRRAVSIDPTSKTVTLADGAAITYDALVATLPLDVTLDMAGAPKALKAGLKKSATHVIGVGVRGRCPHPAASWFYFPEADAPFYRATVFSNYAKGNCPPASAALRTLCRGDGAPAVDDTPRPGPYWSLMFEVCETDAHAPVDATPTPLAGGAWPAIVAATLRGAVSTTLLAADADIVSLFHTRLEHGYPTPSLGRDAALSRALPWLKERAIWSRGRFGSWRYECGNQDHAVALGVEAVDSILYGTKEVTLHHPTVVNGGWNDEPRYTK